MTTETTHTQEPEQTIDRPKIEELARYVASIAGRAGFRFKADKERGLVRFSEPNDFYWTIDGTLPIDVNERQATLEYRTRDVSYTNSLGGVLGTGDRKRFLDREETLELQGCSLSGKRSSAYYTKTSVKREGGEEKTFSALERSTEQAQTISRKLEQAREIAEEKYPSLAGMLDAPWCWALDHYDQRDELSEAIAQEIALLNSPGANQKIRLAKPSQTPERILGKIVSFFRRGNRK